MNVIINGDARTVDEGTTVAAIIDQMAADDRGIAVAVNREVVARSVWSTHVLAAGDRVEVLGASQGG